MLGQNSLQQTFITFTWKYMSTFCYLYVCTNDDVYAWRVLGGLHWMGCKSDCCLCSSKSAHPSKNCWISFLLLSWMGVWELCGDSTGEVEGQAVIELVGQAMIWLVGQVVIKLGAPAKDRGEGAILGLRVGMFTGCVPARGGGGRQGGN